MLVALLVVIIIRVPPIAAKSATARAKPSSTASAAPSLAGPFTRKPSPTRVTSHAGLNGAVLPTSFARKDFQRGNAAGAIFADSLLNGANFTHANLRGADLRGACLRGAVFTAAELAGRTLPERT